MLNKRLFILTAIFLLIATLAWATGGQEAEAGDGEKYDVTWSYGYFGPEPDPDGLMAQTISENTNVNLEFDLQPSGTLRERLPLLISSGQYSDIVTIRGGDTLVHPWAADGLFWPVGEAVANHENLNRNRPPELMASGVVQDGRAYVIPNTQLPWNFLMGIRKDWLDNLGLEMPETWAELTEIARAFTYDDPDGDGEDNTWGYALATNFAHSQLPYTHFGVVVQRGENMVLDNDGTINFGLMTDKGRAMVEWYRQAWDDGLIFPASVTMSYSQTGTAFSQGRFGINRVNAATAFDVERNLQAVNPDAEIAYLPPLENPPWIVGGTQFSGTWRTTGITNAVQEEAEYDAIIDMMDWLLSEEGNRLWVYGVEGVHWEGYDEYGNPAVTDYWQREGGVNWGTFRNGFDIHARFGGGFNVGLRGTPEAEQIVELMQPWIEASEPFPNLASYHDRIIYDPDDWNRVQDVAREGFLKAIIGEDGTTLDDVIDDMNEAGAQELLETTRQWFADNGYDFPAPQDVVD